MAYKYSSREIRIVLSKGYVFQWGSLQIGVLCWSETKEFVSLIVGSGKQEFKCHHRKERSLFLSLWDLVSKNLSVSS
ncbi:hypothetical protein DAI22_01g153000 [Oryza sativa Japonica Group]|jgi:hypothetical protein|nr:hypothetical protein DAI22_01g153000 [Oryza sativa Japonica Group]